MTSRPQRSSSTLWALTALATLIGAGLGGYLAVETETDKADQRVVVPAEDTRITVAPNAGGTPGMVQLIGDAATGSAVDATTGWLRRDRVGTAAAKPLAADAWPIVLHRAGDGQFYADLSLDGHIVNGRVDPAQPRTTLRSADLPADAGRNLAVWQVQEVVLEHLRLPAAGVAVSDDAAAETVIGDDLLGRFFTIEEYFDRLRLVPRAG